MLYTQNLNSEDVKGAPADDEDAVPDAVFPLLEQYPLNITLAIGEHLMSDEIARKCPHDVCPHVTLIVSKGWYSCHPACL